MRKLLLFLVSFSAALILNAQPTVYHWVPQILSPGNNLQELSVMGDNSHVIVGHNNTFAKSTDAGISWKNLNVVDADFDFTSLSMNSAGVGMLSSRNAKIIDYAAGNDVNVDGRLLKTTDFGTTWTILSLNGIGSAETTLNPNKAGSYQLDLYSIECIDADKAFAYVGWRDVTTGTPVSFGAVFETSNGGTNWAAISGNLGSNIITAIKTVGANTFVAGNNTLFKKSGANATDLYPALTAANTDASIYIFDIDVISEDEFYVVTTNDGLFRTTNAGTSFTKLTGTGIPNGGNDLKVINANTIMVLGSSANSKLTVNGGTTWLACYPGVSCWEIAGVFNDSVVATARNDIYKIALTDLSAPTGKWVKQTITDLGVNIQQLHIIDGDRAILAGYGELVKATSDKGKTWTEVTLPELFVHGDANAEYKVDFRGICTSNGVSYANSRRFYFVDYPTSSPNIDLYFPGLIYMSKTNWETFELLNLFDIGKENAADPVQNPFHANCYGFEPFSMDCITDSILLVWAQWYDTTSSFTTKVNRSSLFRTSDNGKNWKKVTGDMGSLYINDIHFVDENIVYVAGNKTLLKSTDGGKSFTDIYNNLDPGGVVGMFINSIICQSASEIYLTTTADYIWKTTNGGDSFTKVSNLVSGCNDMIKLSDTHLLALGSNVKSYLSWNGGLNWEVCYPGSTVWTIGGIVNDSVYALTKGAIYKHSVAELLGVGVNVEKTLSDDGSVNIYNRLEELEVVSSKNLIDRCVIYSITGSIMASQEPKSSSCIFSKADFAPGVYIIATFTGTNRQTHKVKF